MRLLHSDINGFFHFTQPSALDYESLPDGLIAVVGANGAGKTSTVLDAPFACLYGPGSTKAFPSRDGRLSDYATSPSAYIETLWDLGGVQYRARVNVDGVKRKTDATLEEVGRGPLNKDGLIDTFRDAVQEHFPTLRSLLASAYAAQNRRGGFGELSQTERIALFRELADLAHLEEKSQTAKRARALIEACAGQLRVEMDTLRRDASDDVARGLRDRRTALSRELHIQHETRAKASEVAESLRAKRPGLAHDAERYATAMARLAELTETVTRADAALRTHRAKTATITPEHERTLAQIDRRYTSAIAALDVRRLTATTQHQAAVSDRQTRIANNRRILTQADDIRRAVTRKADAERGLVTARQAEVDARKAHDDARDQKRWREIKLAEIVHAERRLADVRTRVALLTTVKFGDECSVDPVCPLVTDAVAARPLMAELEGEIAHRASLEQGVDHWEKRATDAAAKMVAAQKQVRALEQQLVDLGPVASLAPHLDHAEQKIAEYQTDLATAEQTYRATLAALDTEAATASQTRDAERSAAVTAHEDTLHRANNDEQMLIAALETASKRRTASQTESASTSGAKAALDRLDGELTHTLRAQSDADTAVARLQAEHDAVERQLADVQARLDRATVIAQRLRRADDEALAWGTLAKALGRDGIQRLEIDAAGPIVSDLANQLLEVGYGPRFSVDLVTQISTADGKDVKEKFTVLAVDNEHGGEPRDIGDLSGGERVIVEEAIRAALQCYVSLRSQQPCRTIWRDETTGALDPETAPRYVAMLRKMRAISGATQVLFITHSDDCARLADAQIHVVNGQATVVLPPYGDDLRAEVRRLRQPSEV